MTDLLSDVAALLARTRLGIWPVLMTSFRPGGYFLVNFNFRETV